MDYYQQIRQTLRQQRKTLSTDVQARAALQVVDLFKSNPLFLGAQRLAFYDAMGGELDPKPLMRAAWSLSKFCYLPVVIHTPSQMLKFVEHYHDDPLTEHQFGMGEPHHPERESISPAHLDLVFVPLLGFDTNGHRIGMGSGYYDRTFAYLINVDRPTKPYLCGLAYEFQKLEHLKTQPWDIQLDGIVTEKKFYPVNHRETI